MAKPQLAQVNIATLRHPIADPRIADFVENLPLVNSLGEASPGFIWRLQTPAGDATAVQAFDDPLIIINLTVWESIAALRQFAYRGTHKQFFQRRGEWFESGRSATALWWIPAGLYPDERDVRQRIDFLRARGPSPYAFPIGAKEPQLVICRADLGSEPAQRLIGQLNADLSARYPDPGSNFFHLDHEQVAPGRGTFLVASLDGLPVACGGYRKIADDTGEVKRMYVGEVVRGLRLGASVLSELELAARRDGVKRMVLETGPDQHEAIALYKSAGYEVCDCWGEYVGAPASVCFAKAL